MPSALGSLIPQISSLLTPGRRFHPLQYRMDGLFEGLRQQGIIPLNDENSNWDTA
jgi:hypothetical protein